MSYTRPRQGWEDQKFSSKDVFGAVNKRIKPTEELDEGERPVLNSAGLFDVSNEIYIKIHEERKKAEIDRAASNYDKDTAEFKQLSTSTVSESIMPSLIEPAPANCIHTAKPTSLIEAVSVTLPAPSPPTSKLPTILSGYSSDSSLTPRKPLPSAEKLISKKPRF
jgi:hypothetical protein